MMETRITPDQAKMVVETTVARGWQTIVRKVLAQFFSTTAVNHTIAAAIVVAGAEAMVTTGMKSKQDYLEICAAAFDHAIL